MKEHYKYLIVGAGGAGLQMGYFLNKAGLDYIILEKNETAGSFFRTHPVHGRLISINKKHNFFEEEEFNMRHDWNSLISEEEEKLKFLSKQFSNFFSSYTQSLNKVYKRRGSLFLKNFKRKEVLSERYVRTLILYIHLNPIKHGFTKEINEWNWHSFEDFPKTYPELFEAIFSTEKDYKDLHLQKKDTFLEYDGIENDILQNY